MRGASSSVLVREIDISWHIGLLDPPSRCGCNLCSVNFGGSSKPRAARHPHPRHGVCCLQSQGPSQTRHNTWHRRCVLFVQWLQDLGVLPCCSGVEQQLLFGRDTACRTPLLVGSLGFSKVVVVQPESFSNRWRHHFW